MEKTIVTRLADFTADATFKNLPAEAVEESKRLILDSVGCALGGVGHERSRSGVAFARTIGAQPEATVLAFGERLSCFGAAFANAEMMNALDFDAILAPGHIIPYTLPGALAVAERDHASGKQLITANALAQEMSFRIGGALTDQQDIRDGRVHSPPVYGYSCSVFGGAAAVGKVKNFSREMLADTLGLAGCISPANSHTPFVHHAPTTTIKYLLAGWMTSAALTAAGMAQAGHRGDARILEDEYGYYRFMGSLKWTPEFITDKLGEEWRFPVGQRYKIYPHCGLLIGQIDCLTHILAENNIRSEEIEAVKAWVPEFYFEPVWANRTITNTTDPQFSMAHALALVAHRIPPGPRWQDWDVVMDPSILKLMDRVSAELHPGYIKALQEEPRSRMSKVEVRARGKVFTEERRYPRGGHSPDPKTFVTTDELVAKFRKNAERSLPARKMEPALDALLNLEKVEDVARIMELFTINVA